MWVRRTSDVDHDPCTTGIFLTVMPKSKKLCPILIARHLHTTKRARMTRPLRRRLIALLVCLALLFPARPARAAGYGTSIAIAVVALVGITVAVTLVIVHSAHHSQNVTGCAVAGADGMTLQNEGDQQTFLLTGDTVGIKAGDRVKLKGKKKSRDATGSRHFVVEQFKKDYGVCKALPAAP